MLKPSTFYFILFTFCLNFTAYSQEFPFFNVNHRIALPSLECYNLVQDKQGAIWISTEKGLLRFNGDSTKVFNEKNGLPEKAVYASLEHQGKLWFASSKNRILNYQNGKLQVAKMSSIYQKTIGTPIAPNFTYALNAHQNNIYLRSGWNLYSTDTFGTKMTKFLGKNDNTVNLIQTVNGLIPVGVNVMSPFNAKSKHMLSVPLELNIIGIKGNKNFKLNIKRKINGNDWRILTRKTKKYHFISILNNIIKIDIELNTTEIISLPAPIIGMYTDKDGGLWAGTMRRGVYYYNFSEEKPVPVISLRNSSVTGILQDREGSIWCTTLEDGVFMLFNKQVIGYQNISLQSVPPTLLRNLDGKLWISTPGYGLQYFDISTNRFVPVDLTSTKNYHHIWHWQGKYYLNSDAGLLQYNQNGTHSYIKRYTGKRSEIMYDTALLPSGDLYSITYDRIIRTDVKTGKQELVIKLEPQGRSIEYINQNTLIYSCGNGVYLYDIYKAKSTPIISINKKLIKIFKAKDAKLWICSSGDGLFTYKNGQLSRVNLPVKMQTNTYFDITQDQQGNLWVSSDIGLIKISERDGRQQAEIYGINEGLQENKTYRLAAAGNKLFFSNSRGLFSIPTSVSLKNTVAPLISLANMSYRGKFEGGKIKLPYSNNRLSVTFNLDQYKNEGNKIGYSLGLDQPVTYIKGNTVELQHLSAGSYELRAFAINKQGKRSVNTVALHFIVQQPFWMQWWVLASMFALIILIIWLIKNWQVKRIKQKEAENLRINNLIAESKLTALQARMNPHFIFNAINSIQNYIYKNKADDAHHYLTKFSRLIRLILQQSADKFITLDRELESLQLYIELEQLRFRNVFSYQINIPKTIQTHSINIPTMLVQPYVENAIWHGLMNLGNKRKGELHINISNEDQKLTIAIIDNGIGRKKAAELRKNRHDVPTGMMLTENRLKILREMYHELHFEVQVKDLYNNDGEANGTCVNLTLSIPKPYLID